MNRSIRSPMRLNLALAGLLIATAARASLVVEVQPGHYAIHAGESVVIDGSLYNSGMDSLFINGASSDLDSLFGADLATNAFLASAPLALGPGESWNGPLLSITMAAGADTTLSTHGITVMGGATPYEQSAPGTAYFLLDSRATAGTTSVPGPSPVAALRLSVAPNPSRAGVTLAFSVAQPAPVWLEIYDALGRRVKMLESGRIREGAQRMDWDGRTESGRRRQVSNVRVVLLR